jgi:hypothetical protein
MMFGPSALNQLPQIRKFKRRRVSSYDRTGGNADAIEMKPGEKRVIFDIDGPGCIKHIWTTQSLASFLNEFNPFYVRHTIIRMWWDNEENPSVECPLGDFFGLGHGETKNFNSLPLQMSPLKGKAMNSWWAMPFKTHAKIEVEYDVPNGDDLCLFDITNDLTPIRTEIARKCEECNHSLCLTEVGKILCPYCGIEILPDYLESSD